WSLEHGLEELIHRPVLEGNLFEGLRDTGEVFKEEVRKEGISFREAGVLDELIRVSRSLTIGVVDALQLLRRIEVGAGDLAESAGDAGQDEAGGLYWARQMQGQISAWLDIRNRYLGWLGIVCEKTEEELAPLGAEALHAIRLDSERAPSLYELATGRVGCIRILQSIREQPSSAARPFLEWIDRVIQAFEKSKWLAGEMLGLTERLIQDVRKLSESINMRFLYDVTRKLFAIGFNVSDGRQDSAFFDLLASEARIGSYAAIARGEVPIEHWFSMGRPYGAVGR